MSTITADAVLSGNRLALARLLTQIENQNPDFRNIQDALFPYTGKAYLIGISGAPGSGKSTLVNELIQSLRKPTSDRPAYRVAVVAVDASSPFSGGAVLGDRIRMHSSAGDPGVFVRSMSARGALGGLAAATAEMVDVLDAAGYEIILIETVGVGQSEVDIARLAHTTLIIESPGRGDDIQAIKAGIFEIADIFVINKADRPGVNQTETALRSMLDLSFALQADTAGYAGRGHASTAIPAPEEKKESEPQNIWTPPVLKTIATQKQGIDELLDNIFIHKAYLNESGGLHKRDSLRLEQELRTQITNQLYQNWHDRIEDQTYRSLLQQVQDRKLSPHQAAQRLLE